MAAIAGCGEASTAAGVEGRGKRVAGVISSLVIELNRTYCSESCRNCLRARTYIMLATRPTASTSPKAQAAALISAGPWEGAWAGAGDWFGSGEMPKEEEIVKVEQA